MKIPQAFSYFGGKSRIADQVWKRFGNISIYIEPFAGSASILLNSPYIVRTEILNDKYSFITNFFRSAKYAPNKTAKYAQNLISETELHAIQDYLIKQKDSLTKKLESNLEYFDPKIAGLWVFGLNSWMGTNWCSNKTLYKRPSFYK
jgi:DNA adenine methylase